MDDFLLFASLPLRGCYCRFFFADVLYVVSFSVVCGFLAAIT